MRKVRDNQRVKMAIGPTACGIRIGHVGLPQCRLEPRPQPLTGSGSLLERTGSAVVCTVKTLREGELRLNELGSFDVLTGLVTADVFTETGAVLVSEVP